MRQETDFFLHCKKVHSPYFSLFYTESEQFQITVVVSKKICKLATQRNAVKRRYTSALQDLLEELRQLKIKVAIVVHEKGISLSVAEIAQHIKINVQKIRI
ncbi:MAG: hypothetical protein BroJett025_11130 [Patescibacteria group bacterium]|nr:MAG: hypothetical protein BroJett025_11130 [Patescibacteria group bacterium]